MPRAEQSLGPQTGEWREMKLRALFVLVILGLLAFVPIQVNAQASPLTIGVTSPSENETFYSSPSTLQYSIQIKGWVKTTHPEPSLVRVRLDILRDNVVTANTTTRLNEDGSFAFDVTVDPDAPRGEFTIAEIENGCENCHYQANLALPRGKIILRVTAIEPSGRQATADRRIIVDRSTYNTVPVRVVRADQPNEPVANVPVSSVTRLYFWRARHHAGVTNANGEARVQVETLSQAPTRYLFRVEPTIVDGVLFESVAPVTVTFPSSVTAPITLRVTSRHGEIAGNLDNANQPVVLRAIYLPTGASFKTQSTTSGAFRFASLPIGAYLVLPAMRGKPQTIDLTQTYSATMKLALNANAHGNTLSGLVRDAQSAALPFAWVALDKVGVTQRNAPDSGAYSIGDLRESLTTVASAPGYFNQAQVVDLSANRVANFALTRRPETQSIAWGDGEVVVPPESQVRADKQNVALDYGWLWGNSNAAHPLTIRVADATITLSAGKFAIEYFPDRNVAWFYLSEGVATVRANNEIALRAGEMVTLMNARLTPVPLDSFVVTALNPVNGSPIIPTWEPTLDARARDQLAQMGVSIAQVTTFVTYFVIVLVLGLSPLAAILWWWRRRSLKI